jgi:peptide/nickel transport system permease protein
VTEASGQAVRRRESWLMEVARRYFGRGLENLVPAVALLVTVLILVAALLAPLLAPTNPYDLAQVSVLDANLPPGAQSMTGLTFWLGTDGVGRDMLSAMLYGLRLSITVALSSTLIALLLGAALGLQSGYVGGIFDSVLMRIIDIQLGFPSILVALILIAILGPGTEKVIIAIAVSQWAVYVRIMRAGALVEREREYVMACRGLRLGAASILFRHLLPNCLPPLIVVATVQVANAIALEATLSFLGLGLPPTEPSLGLLIANGFEYLLVGQYWISITPGLLLVVTVLCINLVGDRIREILNPKLRDA